MIVKYAKVFMFQVRPADTNPFEQVNVYSDQEITRFVVSLIPQKIKLFSCQNLSMREHSDATNKLASIHLFRLWFKMKECEVEPLRND